MMNLVRFFKKNKAINWVIIDLSKPKKPPHSFFFQNYIIYLSFIFEILSLKEQQLFKGFTIFGTLGVKNFFYGFFEGPNEIMSKTLGSSYKS
ncbi:hypothetical protein BpHYR1_023151 [Brachionus plicatilis]|uniref:Uncharacterized protein n=1 Tax=Brachionus plicatilis TaxID=10195 RepID=A0A3M7S997_BRAPC|nr:hypothetical protein BpHYR1_023151 [Brachionus plicatilis]